VRARRVERWQKIHNRLKKEDKGKFRVSSEEKAFTTDATINRRYSR